MRVNKAIEDGSFFENPALVGAFERGERVHLLGLVSHGGVHSHIDHLQALLRFAPGEDVDPRVHRRPRRLADTPRVRRPRRAAARPDRHRRRPLLRDGPRPALGADAARARRDRRRRGHADVDDPSRPCSASYDARRHRRVHRADRASTGRRGSSRATRAIFFNFRPDRARQLSRCCSTHGVDLTTMTRYARRPRLPGRVRASRTCRHARRGARREHGLRQLHVAETEKYAHVTYFFNGGREEAWPGETRILVPSPRDVPSYDHKPEMSAAEVADRFVERDRRRLRLRVVNFANPDMVGHTGSIPAVIEAVRDGRPLSRPGRRRGRASRRRLPRHRRPRERRADARGRRRQPAHGAHDQPGPARAHRRRR